MSTNLFVDTKTRQLRSNDISMDCAIGKGGALPAPDKREGDGATPLGRYPLRALYARPDRVSALATGLPLGWLSESAGWCDDPGHPDYNTHVGLPFAASHERLWRDDGLYDLIVTLGHNDAPAVPGLGSAIFLHCCKWDDAGGMKPTLGCIAIPRNALLRLVARLGPDSWIDIA